LQFSIFTRINVAIGVLAFSLIPMVVVWTKIRAGQMDSEQWAAVVLSVAFMQGLLILAQNRCSSEEMPFWRGLMVVGASMRTGWMYVDVFLALIAVPLAITAAIAFLLRRNPAASYYRLIYFFYKNRMEQ